MLRCPRDRVKGLAVDPLADSGESTSKPTEPMCWSEVTPMQRIVIFLLGLLLGGGLTALVPPGQAHDDLTGALASPENHPLLLHMTTCSLARRAISKISSSPTMCARSRGSGIGPAAVPPVTGAAVITRPASTYTLTMPKKLRSLGDKKNSIGGAQ